MKQKDTSTKITKEDIQKVKDILSKIGHPMPYTSVDIHNLSEQFYWEHESRVLGRKVTCENQRRLAACGASQEIIDSNVNYWLYVGLSLK
jgi:hypothetical protein